MVRRQTLHRLLHKEMGNSMDAAGLLIHRYLAIGASAARVNEQRAQVVYLAVTAQVIEHIVHEIERLANRLAHTQTAVLHKIDHLRIQPIERYERVPE